MNSENQKPNDQKPNYDFIMDQPGVEDKQKPKRKLIIIVVLVVVLIIAVVIGFVIDSNRNVQPTTSTITPSAQDIKEVEVAKQFLKLSYEGKFPEGYKLYDTESADITEAEFTSQSVPFLQKLNLNECQIAAERVFINNVDVISPVAWCTLQNNTTRLGLKFEFNSADDPKIIKISPMETEE